MKTIKKKFPRDKFPQLYSGRGFEKSRVKFIIPGGRDELAIVKDKFNKTLNVNI